MECLGNPNLIIRTLFTGQVSRIMILVVDKKRKKKILSRYSPCLENISIELNHEISRRFACRKCVSQIEYCKWFKGLKRDKGESYLLSSRKFKVTPYLNAISFRLHRCSFSPLIFRPRKISLSSTLRSYTFFPPSKISTSSSGRPISPFLTFL